MTEPADIAIVGGGASGVYTAWRLAQATDAEVSAIRQRIGGTGKLRIALYERSDRIGGRLLSASPGALPGTPMELGGMRYLSNQPLVKGLVEKKLCVGRHEQVVDVLGNIAYLRGRLFRQSDLHMPGVELPYGLREREKWVVKDPATATPAQLIFWAVFREFPQIQGMEPAALSAFLRDATVDGKPLWQVGFWNLLSRHLSSEGRALAISAIGYDVLGANANAVDIIAENFDFTPNTQYFLFDEGFESIFWKLADDFEAQDGTIHKEKSLESFDTAGGGGFTLTFEGGRQSSARAVVLAMPRAAILRLRRIGPVLDPAKAPHVPRLLNAVEGIPLYKLFAIYPRPWWQEQLGLAEGRSLTDLPVRQCYYWATNPGGPSAIMAYNDQDSASYWGGYQTGPLGPGDTALESGDTGALRFRARGPQQEATDDPVTRRRRANWDAHGAPHEMVMEMHRQLMEMHGVTTAPEPIDAAFMDWMNPPYGGAVHFWNPGHRSWEVRERMTQPVDGVNAFVVGEAWSTAQTWVEGALQTAEIMLQRRLGMGAPSWVDGDGGIAA
jgi:predicted NAD/FAD-dependent oxidoreductase